MPPHLSIQPLRKFRLQSFGFSTSEAGVRETRADEADARILGIDAVPCFIVNAKHAISGAQPPETFNRIFDLAGAEEGEKV